MKKKIQSAVDQFNQNFKNDFEFKVGKVDLELHDTKKIDTLLYARLDKEEVVKALNFFQSITII